MEAKVALQLTVSKKTKKLWDEFCKANPGNHESRLLYLLGLDKKLDDYCVRKENKAL